MQLGYFCNAKCQRGFLSTLAFLASRRACRPTAVFPNQLTRSCARPASREARCRAAVSPQPSRISPECPAPYGRGVGCRGSPPAASHEACRRMAVFSIQLTRNHTRPASRGTCRATAVKPRPSRMSPYAPARIARSPKGAQPLGRLVSSRAMRQVCLERSMCLRIRRSKLSRSFCST